MAVAARPSALPQALYRAAEVREIDRRAIREHGLSGYSLMCAAGEAAFSVLRARWPTSRRLVVVCGAGNNAGDGYVVARLARQSGWNVEVLYLRAPDALEDDALIAAREALMVGVNCQPFSNLRLTSDCVLVDALFGIGLQRPVKDEWAAVIQAINTYSDRVLALDVPSGLCPDRGTELGVAVRACATVSFIALKQGLCTGRGPDRCGTIHYADLGVPSEWYSDLPVSAWRYNGEDLERLLPRRPRDAHKGQFGHALIVGGDRGMVGAVRMAGEAAARCGAGLVSVATRTEHAPWLSLSRPEIMAHGVESATDLEPLLNKASVVAIGPGLGQDAWGKQLLDRVIDCDLPLVLDADALNLLAQHPRRRHNWVLTPHSGEAARLLKCKVAQIEGDRYRAVAELQRRYGGVVILKGTGSLLQVERSTPLVNCSGNPGMASGGMGDVLTGIIAALRAQGLEAAAATRVAMFVHGRAADVAARSGERGLLASDLFQPLRGLVNPCV